MKPKTVLKRAATARAINYFMFTTAISLYTIPDNQKLLAQWSHKKTI